MNEREGIVISAPLVYFTFATTLPCQLDSMESLISDTRLPDDLAAFKATAGLLATQKIRYSANYVPPIEERHRKATLVNVR